MIAIVDYGVGNLFSLHSSLEIVGAKAEVTGDKNKIRSASKIILPGVGAFPDAVKKLRDSGLFDVIKEEAYRGKHILGICLGMQLLFCKSFEFGEHEGLALLQGNVVPMKGTLPAELKIPHIGWNQLHFIKKDPLFKYINENDCVYFVHSYYADGCEDSLTATAQYGKELTAAVGRDNIAGCQFHPEKSGKTGLNILKAFCERGD